MKALIVDLMVEAYGLSDIGLVRDNNEDAWMADPNSNIFIVADGMGGHSAGEVAAQEAVKAFAVLMRRLMTERKPLADPVNILEDLIAEVNDEVHALSRKDRDLRGMGTTLCCACILEKRLYVGNVGDSRCYLLREEKLKQLTEDHSLVAELLELGELSQRQAKEYAHRNIITKSIGAEPEVDPSVRGYDLRSGDQILLCSDGLTDLLPHGDIERVLNKSGSLEESVKNLVDLANRRGGHDNITAILMSVSKKS